METFSALLALCAGNSPVICNIIQISANWSYYPDTISSLSSHCNTFDDQMPDHQLIFSDLTCDEALG